MDFHCGLLNETINFWHYFQILSQNVDEGSQEDFWQLARHYLETLREDTGVQKLKAIFPDAGAAALLKHWWKDANFSFASLSDRKPVQDEDEIVVMIAPDYQMLESVE